MKKMRHLLVALAMAFTLTGGIAAVESANDSAPSVQAHGGGFYNDCTYSVGNTGSDGSYARAMDKHGQECWYIIRTRVTCTGYGGTASIWGPWRASNGIQSLAYCSQLGGAFATRVGRGYAYRHVGH